MKHLFTLLLAFLLPLLSYADDSGTCGENLTYTYEESTQTLTITGNGKMSDYTWYTVPWAAYKNGIKTIIIADGVKSIGANAFTGCSGLIAITIPEGVTSIGNYSFSECSSLASITIPGSVTSIGSCAFRGCRCIASITIPNGVTSIHEEAFSGCSKLTFVTIPQSVTSIVNSAFSNCSSLTRVELNSNAITSRSYSQGSSLKDFFGSQVIEYILGDNVESIGASAFSNCSGLTAIAIPESVTNIGSAAFYGCYKLTKADFKSLESLCRIKFYNVTSNPLYLAHHLYINGQEVTNVTIPQSVTTIDNNTFSGCSSLTSIVIPETVTSIGKSAFSGCSGLTSIEIPSAVTSIGESSFSDCSSLTSIEIPRSVTSIGKSAFSGCSGLTSVVIPSSVTYIGASAFENCSGLTSIDIPSGVTSIMGSTFSGCSSLASIEIPSSVTSIKELAFSGCSGLASIRVAEDNPVYDSRNNCNAIIKTKANTLMVGCNNTIIPESVISIDDNAFRGSGLTSIEIPNTVTSIGSYSFSDCKSLTSIEIPSSITSISSYAFMGSGLISITLPQSLQIIDGYAFKDCINLANINIPDGVTSFPTQYNPFEGCNNLKSITIGSGLTSGIEYLRSPSLEEISVAVGNSTYDSREDCNAVIETATNTLVIGSSRTIIPESVTTIGSRAFSGCSGLTSITFPESVTSIGEYAFYNNTNIKSITIPKNISVIKYSAFVGCPLENIIALNCRTEISGFSTATCNHAILYVPVGKRWEAIYDGGWGQFNNIREMAMEVDDLSQTKAYSLMNIDDFSVSVYDAVNDRVASIGSLYDVDENIATNGWQIVKQGNQQCLYNIGARLYASPTSEGTFALSQTPTPINIRKGKDGLILDDSNCQWGFVLNEKIQPEKDPTGIERVVDDTTSPTEIFTIDGRRAGKLQRGLNIVKIGNKSVKVVNK